MSTRSIAKRTKKEMNMTEGPLFGKIVMFALPLMLSGILQLLYNAADTIVVGRFAENGQTGCLSYRNEERKCVFPGRRVQATYL